jgi:hypothetical protein
VIAPVARYTRAPAQFPLGILAMKVSAIAPSRLRLSCERKAPRYSRQTWSLDRGRPQSSSLNSRIGIFSGDAGEFHVGFIRRCSSRRDNCQWVTTTMDGSFSMSAIAASATMTTGGCVSETMRSELGALWGGFQLRYGSPNLQILRNQIGGTGPAKLVLQHGVNATTVCSARDLWSCADRISELRHRNLNSAKYRLEFIALCPVRSSLA